MGASQINSPFQTTRWTLVANVRQVADPTLAQQALADLCRAYWYPLYAFARRTGCSVHNAQDVTQSFFGEILRNNLFAAADREKGRLRNFLLTAFRRHIRDTNDWEHTLKRGGTVEIRSLNLDEGEERYVREPAHHVTPEMLYERNWALAVLRGALIGLAVEEACAGREAQFTALEGFLSPESAAEGDYTAASAALQMTEEAVRKSVSRLRKKFRICLRRQIADTLDSPSESQIDEELASLGAALTHA